MHSWLLAQTLPSFTEFVSPWILNSMSNSSWMVPSPMYERALKIILIQKERCWKEIQALHQKKSPFLFILENLKILVPFLQSLRIHTFSPHISSRLLSTHMHTPPITRESRYIFIITLLSCCGDQAKIFDTLPKIQMTSSLDKQES